MSSPTLPTDEARRLAVLRDYDVLDTPPEQALDELTAWAMQICQAPISAVSLVDRSRQWFKARVGLKTTETPRELSFCAHALGQKDLFIVPDATQDERFARNPLVTGEPGIRFYAGAPLITPDGAVLGTLCVIDRVARTLTPEQEHALRVLSRQVMTHLELHRRSRDLAGSERLFQTIFDAEPHCVKLLSANGRVQMMNRAGLRLLEADSLEQIAGESLFPLIDDEDRAQFIAMTERVFRGEAGSMKYRLTGLKGTPRWLGAQCVPLRDESGAVTALLGIAGDITERERTEEMRAASDARYRTLFESAPDGILIASSEGRYLDANASICRMLGFTYNELIGLNAADIVSPAEFQKIDTALSEINAGATYHRDWVFRRKDGSDFAVDVSGSLMPDGHVLAMIRDISRRNDAEAQLKLLETCVARLNDIVLITEAEPIDEPGPRILFVNDAFTRITGYFREEALGRSPRFLQGPKTSRAELDRMRAAMLEFKPVRTEVINYTKSGQEFCLEIELVPVTDGAGRCTHWVAVERDITERKRSEARFRWLVDSNAQGVMFWKMTGEITGANHAFLRTVGYSREDLEAGRINWLALSPPEDDDLDRRFHEEITATGVCAPFEKEFIRKDGSRVPLLIGAAAFEDDPQEGVSFVLDLTERKAMQHQILRAQRIESIGTLAGGIAHDLNNSLGPIMTAIELLQMQFPDPKSQELLSIIEASARRGADMVRQVLSFARGVEGGRMEVQIKHLANEIEQIVRDTFLKHIQMRTRISSHLWTVMGDPTQLHQVLLNLCVNARDAMPNGGLLILSAENVELDAQYAALHPEAKPGRYVLLEVEDSGTGMPPEILDRMYDPFFTTKEMGKGTGLGLSTSLGIVKSHGGFIRVESKPGKGTTFAVYLPVPAETSPATPATAAFAEVEVPHGHGELILVVDDEAGVREITQRTLEAAGYRVIVAADGTEAVAAFALQPKEIAAVITDMTMPLMDGLATIRVFRKLSPRLPIAATSGLPEDRLLSDLGVAHFLPKPYTAAALLKVVADLLATFAKAHI